MVKPQPDDSHPDAMVLGLQVLIWVLSEPRRADRLLALTGLDPDALRAGIADPAVLAAAAEFLCAHEPDLLAASVALDVPPARLAVLPDVLRGT